jgi:hypothetical protein
MKDIQQLKSKYGKSALGQVIRILSNHSVIINAGKSDGVFVDSLLQIYEPMGALKDIDGSSLGPLEYVKAEVRVVRAESNYSICETESYQESRAPISPLLIGKRKHYIFETDKDEIEPMQPKNPNVCIGDPVKRA